MKTEFGKKLKEHGFSYQCHTDDFYILSQNNDVTRTIKVKLILSEPIEEVRHISNNGNEIQTEASFKLRLTTEVKEQDFLILAFQNTSNHIVEFIIILPKELMKRLNKGNRISKASRKISIVFWLMPDNCLYETTDIDVEDEWYFLSKGVNGRMADKTEWCYTKFLNGWNRLKTIWCYSS